MLTTNEETKSACVLRNPQRKRQQNRGRPSSGALFLLFAPSLSFVS